MLVEATLDFPEEEIDFLQAADAFGRLARLQARLDQVADGADQASSCRPACKWCWSVSPTSANPHF